jgi:hypothetical protein
MWRIILVKNPVTRLRHDRRKEGGVEITTNGTYPWYYVIQIFHIG